MNKQELLNKLDMRRVVISNLTTDLKIALESNVNEVDIYNLIKRLLSESQKQETLVKFIRDLYFETWSEYEKQLSILKGLE